jgi:hypothetical protein
VLGLRKEPLAPPSVLVQGWVCLLLGLDPLQSILLVVSYGAFGDSQRSSIFLKPLSFLHRCTPSAPRQQPGLAG